MPKATGVHRTKNGSWYFKARSHRDPVTGKWRQVTRRGFATAADALLARQRFMDEVAKRRATVASAGFDPTLTVGELVDRYLDEAEAMDRLAPKTLFDYRNYADSYIGPYLGDRVAGEVEPRDVIEWQVTLSQSGARKRAGGLSSNTIRLARAPLNAAYRFAIENGLVARNPVTEAKPPAKTRSTPAHWTPEQAREFLTWHEGDRLYPVWAFMLSTGLRIGELVWLRWSDIDEPARRVHVRRFASTLGYEVAESSGKSTDAVRTIDIDYHLVDVLDRQRTAQLDLFGELPAVVFTKLDGKAYHPQGLSKLLGRLSVDIGLPRLTAHGLRHTCATLMLASGVPPKVAAERLGHADPTLFTNLYSHVTPTMQREAASRLGLALFEDQGP